MANTDRPNGFTWHSCSIHAKPPALMRRPAASTNEPMAYGDLVSLLAAGSVDRTVMGDGAHGEDTVVGVFESCKYKDASGKLQRSRYLPAAQGDNEFGLDAGAGAWVYFVPVCLSCLWEVQCDDGGAVAIDEDLVGTLVNPIAAAGTDPTQQGLSGHSIMELDTSTAAQSAALFIVRELLRKVDSVISATESDSRYGRALVSFYEALAPASTPTATGV